MQTRWTKPHADEIKMDAEIGSYQLDDEREAPLVALPDETADASAREAA